jgi:myosin heavy subunit
MKLNKETREFKAEDFLWCKVGLDCWVEVDTEGLGDGEVFIRAKLESIDMEKKMAVVAYEDEDFQGPCDVHITRVFLRDPNLYPDLNDLVDLPILNDAELHQKIRDRFACLNIFTYIGPSLLIVNPFKFLADQYKESAKKECYDCILNPTANKVRDKPPHVWAMAANCYLELYNNKMNQACCVSGESGAGKTVNTKTCMSFLTGMNEIFGKGTTKEGETKIEDKILQCNPILEALGNAKTVRNDNSSRFGKYISLFMHNKMVIGASIESYLLEAIRVTTPNRSERNYHIFYQYLKGAPDSEIKEFKLNRKPFTYSFLEKSGCSEVGTVDDLEEYREHEKSMKVNLE